MDPKQQPASAAAAQPDASQWRIGRVAYGEVGRIVAEDLRAQTPESPSNTRAWLAPEPLNTDQLNNC